MSQATGRVESAPKTHLYSLLICPQCGAVPDPKLPHCPQCGRPLATRSGGLDLLDDELRDEADLFAARYQELRTKEGWVGPGGREDPLVGKKAMWRDRVKSISEAAQIFASVNQDDTRPVILDVGSGGGWAARYLNADVIAIDLLDVGSPWALSVRADMRRLPIRSGSVDGILFAASLHYGGVDEVVREGGRVLRGNGVMIVTDSPIYPDHAAQQRAVQRSVAYYSKAGHPELVDYYHPIDSNEFKAALDRSGFKIERFEMNSRQRAFWRHVRRPPGTFVVARRLR
jgi:SAM-dependent methyltransferase